MDAAVVHARSSAIDDSIRIEALAIIMCANSYVGSCGRGIDGHKVAFADIQSAVPKLGRDDVGDRWRHAMAYYIPSALQVAAKALLFLDRQTEPQFVGRLTEAIDSGPPLRTSTNCSAQSVEICDTGSRCIRWNCC